jgi:hypothetical protein
MSALIHKVSASTFTKEWTDEDRLDFCSDICAEWVDACEDGGPAMPTSYSILFERRVAQMAKLAQITPEEAMACVLLRAAELAETGDFASERLLFNVTDEDDEPKEASTEEPSPEPAAIPEGVSEAPVEPTEPAPAEQPELAGALESLDALVNA